MSKKSANQTYEINQTAIKTDVLNPKELDSNNKNENVNDSP